MRFPRLSCAVNPVSQSSAAGKLTNLQSPYATGWKSAGVAALATAFVAFALMTTSAVAATPTPAWGVDSVAAPNDFSAALNDERCGAYPFCQGYTATVTNIGSRATSGATVTIKDKLPVGVTLQETYLYLTEVKELGGLNRLESGREELFGPQTPSSVCHVVGQVVTCGVSGRRAPDGALQLSMFVTVNEPEPASGVLTNTVTVEGGGAASVEASSSNPVGSAAPVVFGFSGFAAPFLGVDGEPEAQAGGHPYELPVKIDLNSVVRSDPEASVRATSVEDLRDAVVDLPLGVSGSAVSAPTCSLQRLSAEGEDKEPGEVRQGYSSCPVDTIVGYIQSYPEGAVSASSPIYNIVAERGVAAEFGYLDSLGGTHVIDVDLAPTPEGYVLRSTAREVPQVVLNEITTEVYGEPAARDKSSGPAVPMFTSPEDCTGKPLVTSIYIDSWQNHAKFNPDGTPANLEEEVAGKKVWVKQEAESEPPVTGCEALAGLFEPSIAATPESTQTDSPTGLQVNLKIPQSTSIEALGTPPVKNTVVTLPEGFTVNPAQANGLQACSEAQIGWLGKSPDSSGEYENFTPSAPECPQSSKVGTVELESPDLSSEACRGEARPLSECTAESEREKVPLTGSIYVARQFENPFGSLLAIYIVIDDERTGVVVKLPGELKLNPSTGQLTATFDDTPQFAFSELRTHFFGGSKAALKTPATCGSYTLTSSLEPWSAPESGPAVAPSSAFAIDQAAGGGACAAPGFGPSFSARTTSPTAGAYSPLVVTLAREDGTQNISSLNVTLPPGVTGKLAGIPQCSEAQIAVAQGRDHPGEGAAELAGPSCPASSEVGTVTVGAGAGPEPYYVTGHVYLAGPYEGAPFSLAIVTPAVAGPFDLGVIVVRAGLYINPVTAQVTTKSDPIPQLINGTGIPTDVRSIKVEINRPGFTLNPTSCAPMTATGEAISTSGQVAALSERFQAGGCEHLKFAPKFTVSTTGHTSKQLGASLTTKIEEPAGTEVGGGPGGIGSQADIAKVKVQLPLQLPSELKTLNKACLAKTFEENPADCPPHSIVGHAIVHTPLLANPLVGPAYFVSHGNEAFPSLTMVLQGENGLTIDLVGTTNIKKGITTTTFKTVPDVPFTTFELTLPQGEYSALGRDLPKSAKESFCGQNLVMPNEFIAQNGAEIHEDTKITITGCKKTKTLTRAQKLKKALKACKRYRKHSKRAKCEAKARKQYGPVKKKGKAKRK